MIRELNKQMKRKINQVLDMLWARKNVQGQWDSQLLENIQNFLEVLAEEAGFEIEFWDGTIKKKKK